MDKAIMKRDKQVEDLFGRRSELVDKPSRSAAEESELEGLRIQISELPTAQDPEDQKAMDFIREAAALLRKHKAHVAEHARVDVL